MYRHPAHSVPRKKLYLDTNRSTSSASTPDDSEQIPIGSTTTLFHMSREAPKKSMMNAPQFLRRLSFVLHSVLVIIHLSILTIWVKGLQNRAVFALKDQNIVSFLITGITQTFGTIYFAVLVLVTQKLSMRQSLTLDQTLTTTHDNTAAWAGIGSAVLYLWHQNSVRASVIGILRTFLYLGGIFVLHITTPGLLALETFNLTSLSVVRTEGLPTILPSYNINANDNNSDLNAFFSLQSYMSGALEYLPYVEGSTHIGLMDGTLYDVPETNAGIGNTTVTATGFNISCGFLDDLKADFSTNDSKWELTSEGNSVGQLESTQPNQISILNPFALTFTGGNFYSTIPIVDSGSNTGGWIELNPPMNTTVSTVQVFQCSLFYVLQTAIVDAQSKKAITLHPELNKTTSTWGPASRLPNGTTGNTLIDDWALWYFRMPPSVFPSNFDGDKFISVADLYLMQKFNLHSVNRSSIPSAVTLHDLENALSELVATMFWTVGHVTPTYEIGYNYTADATHTYVIVEVENNIVLLPGTNANVTEQSTATRLHLNIIALTTGLVTSIVLLLLSIEYLFRRNEKDDQDLPINGTGLLHAIWLYRNHPELELLVEQVEHPTDDNLRSAGMVQTRLVGPRIRKSDSLESFQMAYNGSAGDM